MCKDEWCVCVCVCVEGRCECVRCVGVSGVCMRVEERCECETRCVRVWVLV